MPIDTLISIFKALWGVDGQNNVFKHPDSKTVVPNFVESRIIEFEGVAPKLK